MTIEDRIARLELRTRRQRLGLIGMGLAFAGALFLGMAQQTSKELVLDSLVIMKDGNPRIVMGTNKDDGGVGIAMLDLKGIARVAIGTDAKGDGGLVIMDKKESPRVVMGSAPAGSGIMLIGGGLIEIPMPAEPSKD
jgi:hypothetical protein